MTTTPLKVWSHAWSHDGPEGHSCGEEPEPVGGYVCRCFDDE